MKNKTKRFLMLTMVAVLAMAFSAIGYAFEMPAGESQQNSLNSSVEYTINETLAPGKSFVKDYWVGTNQSLLIDLSSNGTPGTYTDITSTITNLTTGEVVDSARAKAGTGFSYTLDGQNAYFRLKVTINTTQTLTISGWATTVTW
jgi:hypothetical protein